MVREEDDWRHVHELLSIPRSRLVVGEHVIARAVSISKSVDRDFAYLQFHAKDGTVVCCRIKFFDDELERFDEYFTRVAQLMVDRAWWGEMVFLLGRDKTTGDVVIETAALTSFDVKYTFPSNVDFRILPDYSQRPTKQK